MSRAAEAPMPAAQADPGTGASVLYLSFDGMTDPLGRSQVLPYLTGLAERGHRIRIVSLEKPDAFARDADAVEAICKDRGIEWHPLRYERRLPIISAILNMRALRRAAERLHLQEPADLVHARSLLPALAGLALKHRYGVRLLFDMRGFWADERVDGGAWPQSNLLYRLIYRQGKQWEALLLRQADQIVSLTEAGKRELSRQPPLADKTDKIAVIPCCVDAGHFPLSDPPRRATARQALAINEDDRVLVYLGSLGGNYMLGEMLDFFRMYRGRHRHARFLFVTREDAADIRVAAQKRGIPAADLVIRAADRDEVPQMLAAADLGIAFKQPSFSATACSPTKLGEMLAVGLPVIANRGVGDVAEVLKQSGAGVAVQTFDEAAYGEAIDAIERLDKSPEEIRQSSRRWFDLDTGVERYDAIYRALATDRNSSMSRGACEASE